MSGILTQDSISLTESLDGVFFCCLAISSGKAGTIGRKHAGDANKRAKSYCFLSPELLGNRYHRRCSSHRCSKEKKGMVKFSVRLLSLDTLHVLEAGKWNQRLSLVRKYKVNWCDQVHKRLHQQLSNDRKQEIDHRISVWGFRSDQKRRSCVLWYTDYIS